MQSLRAVREFVLAGGRMAKPPMIRFESANDERRTAEINCSNNLWDFVRQCWSALPQERPDFGMISTLLNQLIEN